MIREGGIWPFQNKVIWKINEIWYNSRKQFFINKTTRYVKLNRTLCKIAQEVCSEQKDKTVVVLCR